MIGARQGILASWLHGNPIQAQGPKHANLLAFVLALFLNLPESESGVLGGRGRDTLVGRGRGPKCHRRETRQTLAGCRPTPHPGNGAKRCLLAGE